MSAEAVMMGAAALASIASQYNTNLTNRKIAKDNIGLQLAYNADQIGVAQMNNQTQIDLANTAHQREVNDLRDAGLNPILSATGGNGAAMPSLSGPNGVSAPNNSYHDENPLKELGVTAREIGRYMTEAYDAQVEQAKLSNKILREEYLDAKASGELKRTVIGAEYDAYNTMRHKFLDTDGNEMIHIRDDGRIMLNADYIEDLASAIRADTHNRKWSDVKGWLDTGMRAIDTGVGAYSGISSARNSLMNARHLEEDILDPAKFRRHYK